MAEDDGRVSQSMTPDAALAPGEEVVARLSPDRGAYVRAHAWLAAAAMALGMGALWIIGNPFVWTGAVGGLLAVAARGAFMASEELSARWDLTDRRLLGPLGRAVPLASVARLRTIGSAVQVVTRDGHKHLVKHQADAAATRDRIARAVTAAGGSLREEG